MPRYRRSGLTATVTHRVCAATATLLLASAAAGTRKFPHQHSSARHVTVWRLCGESFSTRQPGCPSSSPVAPRRSNQGVYSGTTPAGGSTGFFVQPFTFSFWPILIVLPVMPFSVRSSSGVVLNILATEASASPRRTV